MKTAATAMAAAIAALGLFAGLAAPAPVRAQSPAPGQPSYLDMAKKLGGAQKPPDIQMIAMPLPTGEWMVTAVYSHDTSKAEVAARQKTLEQLSGWKVHDLMIETRGLGIQQRPGVAADPLDAQIPKDRALTSVTFMTPSNVVNFTDGTIDIAPWILAYKGESRLNLTYLLPQQIRFSYRGLRHYSGPGVDADLAVMGKGALTYAVAISDHNLAAVDLPRYQEAPESLSASERRNQADAARNLKTRRVIGTGLIALFALAAGGLVFFWTTRLAGGGGTTGGSSPAKGMSIDD